MSLMIDHFYIFIMGFFRNYRQPPKVDKHISSSKCGNSQAQIPKRKGILKSGKKLEFHIFYVKNSKKSGIPIVCTKKIKTLGIPMSSLPLQPKKESA